MERQQLREQETDEWEDEDDESDDERYDNNQSYDYSRDESEPDDHNTDSDDSDDWDTNAVQLYNGNGNQDPFNYNSARNWGNSANNWSSGLAIAPIVCKSTTAAETWMSTTMDMGACRLTLVDVAGEA